MSDIAITMAKRLMQRDSDTPVSIRQVKVGRGGLMALVHEVVALNQFEDDVRDVMDFMTDEAAKEDLNNALARLMETRVPK